MDYNEQAHQDALITKKDLRSLYLRSWTIMCSWNYERQMHMGLDVYKRQQGVSHRRGIQQP